MKGFFMKHIQKIISFVLLLSTQTTTPWSFTDTVSNASNNVTGWFSKQETQSSAKEYDLLEKAGTPTPITISNNSGNITVTTWNKKSIMVEAIKKGSEEQIKNNSFTVTIKDDAATIVATNKSADQKPGTIDFNLIIPRSSPLTIRTDTGSIHLHEGVNNSDIQTFSGSIRIENAAQNIIARAPEGTVTIEQQTMPDQGSFLVEAKGNITFVLPTHSNANLSAKTISGKIFSDLFVTIEPITTKLDKDAFKRMQREIKGTLGSGGIPMTLESTSGTIRILEV